MYLEKIKQDHPEDFIDRDPNILDVNNYCNDLQVLDGSYFFGGKIAKHCGLLSHKKEKGIFEK
jgi:hypothetical protein